MRRLSIAGAAVAGLFAGVIALGFLLYPWVGAWSLRSRALPLIEARLGRKVSIGDIEVTRGRAVLEDVVVSGPGDPEGTPLAHVERVVVDFDFWASVRGQVRLGHVDVQGVRATAVRKADGSDNFGDLLDRLRGQDGDSDSETKASGGGSRMRPTSLAVADAALWFHDEAAGVDLRVGKLDAELEATGAMQARLQEVAVTTALGPKAEVASVIVSTDAADPIGHAVMEVKGGTLSAWAGLSLSSIAGVIEPRGRTELLIDLSGSYGGATETLWQANGWLNPIERTGAIDVKADRFTFDRIDSVLRDSMVVEYGDTSLDAAMHIEVDGAGGSRVSFDGTFGLAGVNVFHPMLAEKVVRDIGVSGRLQGSFERDSRILTVTQAELSSGGVSFQIQGSVAMPGGVDASTGARRPRTRVAARLAIPPVPCQAMLDAIPDELVPYLGEFTMRGTFRADVQLAIDWADLQATELGGKVDIFGCKAREPGGGGDGEEEDQGVSRLLGSFTHYVEVERDSWIDFVIGPENPDFVPILDISPHIRNAIMTTEDSRFYDHHGFIPREFRTALIRNLEAGYFRYGASSITMQTVKNVMLYREKTLSRKLQELFLTWYIETQLEKDRIFEIYLNAIEYGPGLYGIGPATRHFFGKHPRDVNPVEAAYIATLLPSPKARYKQYCEDRLWRSTENKVQNVLELMHKRGRLTLEELAVAQQTPLVFDRAEASPVNECKRLVRRAIENARPTNPMKK